MRSKTAVLAVLFIIAMSLVAVFASVVAPKNPDEQQLSARLEAPRAHSLLGTDDLGRDVFSRIVYGARVSLSVGITAMAIAVLLGTLLGLLSGYFGGITDMVIMRLTDIMLCFPTFFLVLLVIAFLEPNINNVMVVIGLTSWPGLTRLVRAEVMSVKERDFIKAAELLGISHIRIFIVHLLPNVISVILVFAALGIGDAILTESGLSFLGLGVQPPQSSWGQMITSGKDYIYMAWWLTLFPGLAIMLTVLSFNLLGESIRDALDPKS